MCLMQRQLCQVSKLTKANPLLFKKRYIAKIIDYQKLKVESFRYKNPKEFINREFDISVKLIGEINVAQIVPELCCWNIE